MSDFDQTSLRDELEVRVIALLTGELSETEADQLEKILANDAELSAFRDRMAELMGELHDGRDELVDATGEPPRQLSDERRARIFGDVSVLEVKAKSTRAWLRPAFWGVAASVTIVGFLSALLMPAFHKVRSVSAVYSLSEKEDSEVYYEVPVASPPPPPEPEYRVNMEQPNRSTTVPRPPAVAVNDPSDLDVPALDIDVATDSSSTYARSGGGFGGGLSSVREMAVSADESIDATAGRDKSNSDDFAIDQVETAWLFDSEKTIPVEIPKELIEGTPQPIRVPGLEPPATEAPRMVVAEDALRQRKAGNKKLESRGARETFGVDLVPDSGGADYGMGVASGTAPVDPFAAPAAGNVSSRTEAYEGESRSDAYASSGPVDAFAAPLTSKPTGQVSVDRQAEVAQLSEKGRALFLNGDYDAAAEAFGNINGLDPNNSEAKLFAKRIDSLKKDISDVSKVKSREQMLSQVSQSWERPKVFDLKSNSGEVAASSLTYKPEAIVIPQVNFSGMPLSKVIETIEELSAVYDPEGTGIQLVYEPVGGHDPKVNISLRNLNVDRILQFVTQQVNYSYDVGADAITIQPGDSVGSVAKVRLTPKPEKLAAEEPFSTFSLNISDVSFKLAQAALGNSRVPPKAQIRTEEFVNSFDYGDPAPRPDEPVALNWEIAQHPFEHDRQVVRFSLQTQASGRASGQPLNISLLVDNSGSMQRPDRRAILQSSLQTLEAKLTPQDNLNIILFARQPRLIAEAQTRASQKAAVESALDYRPEGGTNLEAGLRAAYETAERNFLPNGSNRVIVMTDGAANLGNVNAGQLAEYVVEQRKQGIALDAYGIGWDDYNDALLEEITRNGDGRYAFLNSVEEASADFSEKLAGTLRVAASNVKVQIEWNPDRVQRYRQIGYDLHQLKKEDFRDNTVDAAEIGEAESGTALYVLKIDDDPKIIGGLGTLHVRYLDPASGLYKEHSWPLPMPRQIPAARAASPSMRLAMTSAFFGERLAGSPYAGGYGFNDLYKMTSGLPEAFPKQPRVTQMQSMLLQANELFGENK